MTLLINIVELLQEDEVESLDNDCGIIMAPAPKCDKFTYFRDGKQKIGKFEQIFLVNLFEIFYFLHCF